MTESTEVVMLLRQMVEHAERNAEARELIASRLSSRDADRATQDHENRMKEIKEESAKHRAEANKMRQEDLAYREKLLSLLQQLNGVLGKIANGLDTPPATK